MANLRLPLGTGSTLTLPADVVAALGSQPDIYVVVDEQKQLIMLSARHPDVLHNESILDQLAQLNEGMSQEEYAAPVPADCLQRRGKI